MAKARTLKVFAAPIGFHDALVAAPSRAAALRAWGSEHDLFARGMASEVTDPALTAEPLAHPGEVIRRPRAGVGDGEDIPSATGRKTGATRHRAPPKHQAAKPPKPSRRVLDEAEAALEAAKGRHRAEDAAAKARVEAAQRDRRAGQARGLAEEKRLAAELEAARSRYRAAVARWQATDARPAGGD